MKYVTLIFGVLGLIFTFFWIKNPDNKRDYYTAIMCLFGCIAIILVSLFLILAQF